MINLTFMNKAVEQTDGNEFRLLYVIANTISLKREGHTKIYRDLLADKLNLSTKQISRLTNSLVEKGLLKKDLVSENGKTVCYYSLNLDKSDKKNTTNLDKNVPLNKRNNIKIKGNNMEKEGIKGNNSENELESMCESPSNTSTRTNFNVDQYLGKIPRPKYTTVPNEESLADYLRRTGRM